MTGQHSDANFQTIRSLGLQFLDGRVPEFVKQADVDRDKPASTAPLSVFADPARRHFPIHTKSATYISALYIAGGRANGQAWDGGVPLDVATSRIEKAAAQHGILSEVHELYDTVSTKTASAERELKDTDFALVVNFDGTKVRRFPVVSQRALEKSAEKLEADRALFPYEWRQMAAANLLKAAARSNASLPVGVLDQLAKTAALYPRPVEEAAVAIRARSALFANPEDKQRMIKLAEMVLAPGTDIYALCGILDELDQRTKVAELYSRGLRTPEDIFFSGLASKAASTSEDPIELITGSAYTPEQLKTAGAAPFSVLGELSNEFINNGNLDMDKAADILPTLPRDSAALLDAALNACGVFSKTAEKAAEFEELTQFIVGDDGKFVPAGYRMSYKVAAGIPVIPPVGATPGFSAGRPAMRKPKPAQLPNDEKTDPPPSVAV